MNTEAKREMNAQDKARELLCNECAMKGQCLNHQCYVFKQMMKMHEWADQQRIDKTARWLEEQDFGGWIESETEELINEFKQFAKEEL